MAFTNLRDATREDWDRIDALDEARTDYAAAPLALLESLNGGDPAGYTLNPYDHSRQAATRALRAGEIEPVHRVRAVPRRGRPAGAGQPRPDRGGAPAPVHR